MLYIFYYRLLLVCNFTCGSITHLDYFKMMILDIEGKIGRKNIA